MAYENIALRKPNCTIVDNYFWMMDDDTDSIVVKTDDGALAYSYPLDKTINTSVKSLEYDGRNIWSLRTTGTDEITIERWYINNYVCVLRRSFVFVPSLANKFNSEAFTIEHYHTKFTADMAAGSSVLSIQDGSRMSSGFTLTLGPNHLGQIEERTVSSATSNSVQINGATSYEYRSNAPISFFKRIWLFNNYDGVDSTSGALYCIDAYTGSIISKYSGGSYKDIKACTFFDVPRYVFNRNVSKGTIDPRYNAICFIKGTNMIFLDPNNLNNSFGSMTMDNIRSDLATNIIVYDVAIDGTNVYRLQREATYYGSTQLYTNNTYNYQLSSLNSFITSMNVKADPAILPANGVNTAAITVTVRDQFNLPVQQKQVYFTDDDPSGSILSSPVNTDANGVAQTTYISGTSAREVRISATSQQD
jgi:hypothetical protein